jgi:hypothetical protein
MVLLQTATENLIDPPLPLTDPPLPYGKSHQP